jgi:hypothetical protein
MRLTVMYVYSWASTVRPTGHDRLEIPSIGPYVYETRPVDGLEIATLPRVKSYEPYIDGHPVQSSKAGCTDPAA